MLPAPCSGQGPGARPGGREGAPVGPGPGPHRTTDPATSLSPRLCALLHTVMRELSEV